MNLPNWVLNECKKRKKVNDCNDLPVYELTLSYIDQQGRLRYETKRLAPDMELSFRTLVNLVLDVEDRTNLPLRKTGDGWYQSAATNCKFKGQFSDDGELIGYVPDETSFRSEFKEYDHHG